ncbi:MAG: hypothetical protein KAJ78_02190 [Acidobacteria bacterium]|nr:hypothetical protein [Acidobacteriota bacterium]
MRRSSDLGRRHESSRRSSKWTGPLLCVYVLAAMFGAAALAHALSGLPSEFTLFEFSDDTDVQAEAERVRLWVATEVPAAAGWLAPMGLFDFEDDLRSVLTPNDWELANVSLEGRVERLNHSITRIRADFLNAASLLGVIFFGGFAFACLALLLPSVGSAFLLCLFPLFATPVATEPLIGVDNMSLFYLTLPMLITGGTILLIEITQAIGTSVSGPRSEAWMRIWGGLGLIAIGAAASTVGILLAKATNAGVLAVAVGPVLYGVFSVTWGIVGLFKRRGKP